MLKVTVKIVRQFRKTIVTYKIHDKGLRGLREY